MHTISKPVWLRNLELKQHDETYHPSLKEIQELYLFLRSVKRLADKTDIYSKSTQWRKIKDKLTYLFSLDGFASILDGIEIIHDLEKEGIYPGMSYKGS